MLMEDPRRLTAQMQMYAACGRPDVREVAREGYGELVEFVERASGRRREAGPRFFAKGMLINVMAAMGLNDEREAGRTACSRAAGKD